MQTAQLLDYWPGNLGEVKKNLEEAELISREIDNDDIAIDVATMRFTLSSILMNTRPLSTGPTDLWR